MSGLCFYLSFPGTDRSLPVLPSIMLDVQYRMHPTISRFPSDEFYNNMLKDGTLDLVGNVPARLLPPESTVFPPVTESPSRPSVVFLDHVGAESMKDRSRVNRNEAHIVCSLVEDLLLNNEVRPVLWLMYEFHEKCSLFVSVGHL